MWRGSFYVVSPLPGAPKQKTRDGLLQVIAPVDGRGERASDGVVDGGRGSQSPQLLFLLRGDWTSGSTAWKTVRRSWECLKRDAVSTQDEQFSHNVLHMLTCSFSVHFNADHTQVRCSDAHTCALITTFGFGLSHLFDGVDAHDGYSVAWHYTVTQVPGR